MISLRRFIGGVLAGTLLLGNTMVFAAGPLDLIPQDAAIVGKLKSPQTTLEKVGGFVNAGAPGFGFFVLGQANQLGVLISNTTLGGVDLKEDWYFAAFIQKDAPPAVVFIVPATDEKDLKEAVGNNFTFVTSDKWVAYSDDAAAVQLIAACKEGKSKSITTSIDKRASALVGDSDISVYVNIAKLRGTYAEEFAKADKQIDDALEGIKVLTGGAAQTPGLNLDAIWNMYGKLGHDLVQGARDSESFSLGIKATNEALTIDELLVVAKDSGTDQFLQSHPTSDLSLMSKLPPAKPMYFGLHGNATSVMKWGLDASSSFFNKDESMKSKLEAIQKDLSGVKIGAFTGAFALTSPSDEGIVSGTIVAEASPAAKMREVGRRATTDLKFEIPGVKQDIKITADAEKVGDVGVDLYQIKQEFDENLPGAEAQKQITEVAYGKNGITQRMAALKDHYVQTIGGGSEAMKAALTSLQSTPATKPSAVDKSRVRQLEKANLLFMIDLPNFAVQGLKVADELASSGKIPPLPVPVPLEQIKAVKVDPSYITFAAGTEAQGVRLRTEVPSATVAGFFKLFQAANTAGRAPRGQK